MKRGIDISKWQGKIDFEKVKKAGVEFAIIRAGYGKEISQKDSYFEKNYEGFKKVGIPVGVYWYSYAKNAREAREEALVCAEIIKGKQFEYPIFLDMEEEDGFKGGMENASEIVRMFCSTLEEKGYFSGLYISRSPLQTYISGYVALKYCLWIAEYSSKLHWSGYYGIWQYSAKGRIDGIDGYVDMDISQVDYSEIIKKKGFNGYENPDDLDEKENQNNKLLPYTKINLKRVKLYASSKSNKGIKVSGIFWIYDGKEINGRYRLTNAKGKCNRNPIKDNVTGWVDGKDIMKNLHK